MEKQHYEEEFKKAFMRGVCALNFEAMNLFKKEPVPKDNILPSQNSDPTKHHDTESFPNPTGSSSIHHTLPSSTKVTTSSPPTIPKTITTSTVASSSTIDVHPSSDSATRFEPRKIIPLPARHPLRRPQRPR
jgi:hypothetical protein